MYHLLVRVAALIPARFASERLPGKPLAAISGKPMIVRVLEAVSRARGLDFVAVATDDRRIADAVERAGGRALLTSPACASGTDRVAEAAREVEADAFVNVQGDEPFIEPACVEAVVQMLREGVAMATLWRALADAREHQDPNVVKVVLDQAGRALYFSRAPIPHQRGGGVPPVGKAHVGIYGYTRAVLEKLAALPPSPLEQCEKLEQLRALENGIAIHARETRYRGFGVDTPEDLEKARLLYSAG